MINIVEYLKIQKRYLKSYLTIYFNSKKININKNKRQAYVILGADYTNLGDIAITYAQINFLKENLPDNYEVIEIDVDEVYNYYLDLKKNISNDSIITLIGGGNTGDLYEFIESKRRFILRKFRKNKIISFPQTITYKGDKKSDIYKRMFVSSCKKCKNLTLIAREKESEKIYKSLNTGATILLVPDIVFSLDRENELERKGISIIFRNDKEKKIEHYIEIKIEEYIEQMNIEVSYNDTCDIEIDKDKYIILEEFIDNILNKKLVITDRLHGMILCYITNTPCLVFENNNYKIKSTYNTWLKKQNFIRLVKDNDFNGWKSAINELLNIDKISKERLTMNFDILKRKLREGV